MFSFNKRRCELFKCHVHTHYNIWTFLWISSFSRKRVWLFQENVPFRTFKSVVVFS